MGRSVKAKFMFDASPDVMLERSIQIRCEPGGLGEVDAEAYEAARHNKLKNLKHKHRKEFWEEWKRKRSGSQ